MDRSSMQKIDTTQDLEKRQAFKAKLANKISSPQVKEELSAVVITFNGVAPGGRLVHPSLGEGTLIEVDEKNNEVLIRFDAMGLIGLVLTQAKSFVHAPFKAEAKVVDDPFIGEKIEKLQVDRSDALYRPVKDEPVIKEETEPETYSLEVGVKVFHKELGNCVIVSLNKENNEIVLDSDRHGTINLVFSLAKNALTPVDAIKKEIEIHDDPFLGSTILRDGAVRPDAVQRELSTSKVVSPDFVSPGIPTIPVGSEVWHPGLGACTVLAVDESKNSITLYTAKDTVVMVLSQVRSKLRTIESAVEHVPVKPLVRDKLAPKVPQYTSRSDVVVSIPEVFKTWQRNQQFMYLTRNQKLSTDQANDVFSVLDGGKPFSHSVTITWQSQEETQATIIPGPEALSTIINGVRTFGGLQEKRLWHPDFGECSVASIEGNQLILMTSVGQVPCVLDVTVPKLAVLTASAIAPEHAPKQLGTTSRVLVTSDTPVDERPIVKVTIPEAFVTWRTVDQYQFLTVSRHLIPEHANDIIATMTGKLHTSKTEYVIEWTDEIPEANKRAEFKQQLQAKIEAASVEPVAPAPKAIVASGVKKFVEEVVTKKEVAIKKVVVDLPTDFNTWTSSGKYVFLTRTKQLTFNEANDIMDVLNGKKPQALNVDYIVTWGGSSVSQVPETQRVIDESVQVNTSKETITVLKKVEITLPAIFNNWASSGKFGYLTRTKQLTFDQANDVLAVLDGKTPQNNKVKYEIVWE